MPDLEIGPGMIDLDEPFQITEGDVSDTLQRLLADREAALRSLAVEAAMYRRVALELRGHLQKALGDLHALEREVGIGSEPDPLEEEDSDDRTEPDTAAGAGADAQPDTDAEPAWADASSDREVEISRNGR